MAVWQSTFTKEELVRVNEAVFICCPRCSRKTKTKVFPGTTVLTQFPLWCGWCHEEIIIDYK